MILPYRVVSHHMDLFMQKVSGLICNISNFVISNVTFLVLGSRSDKNLKSWCYITTRSGSIGRNRAIATFNTELEMEKQMELRGKKLVLRLRKK